MMHNVHTTYTFYTYIIIHTVTYKVKGNRIQNYININIVLQHNLLLTILLHKY